MPTNRFSTISTMPIPLAAPISFKVCKMVSGDMAWPFTATGTPSLKSMVTIVGTSGASSGDLLTKYTSFLGAFLGSSKSPPSWDKCHTFWSMEYGCFLVATTGISCFAAYSMQSSRDFNSHSRHGAMIFVFGESALIVNSKRTWSFPLPVAPWAMASAPSCAAISTNFLAINGLAKEVPNRYLPSYTAPALTTGQM